MAIASALGTLGATESAPLSTLCNEISSVVGRLSGLLDMVRLSAVFSAVGLLSFRFEQTLESEGSVSSRDSSRSLPDISDQRCQGIASTRFSYRGRGRALKRACYCRT